MLPLPPSPLPLPLFRGAPRALAHSFVIPTCQEAHETGVAMVVACPQDTAEEYVESLRLNGLISTMEPGH